MKAEHNLSTVDVMNILHNALYANERAGRAADGATVIGALRSLLVIEEAHYLASVTKDVKELK